MSDTVKFTLTTSENPPELTKVYELKDGKLHLVDDGGELISGYAEIIEISFSLLASFLDNLKPNQAPVWGVFKYPQAQIISEYRMRKRLKGDGVSEAGIEDYITGKVPLYEDGRPVIRRANAFLSFPKNEPAVLLGDIDQDENQPPLTLEEIEEILFTVVPALELTARIVRPSTSSDIYLGDELLKSGGWRFHFLAETAQDIPEIGRRIDAALWVSGHGYIKLAKDGNPLARTLLDASVYQPCRLDFQAGAICVPPLERRPTPTRHLPGAKLSLDDLENIPADIIKKLKDKMRGKPETKGRQRVFFSSRHPDKGKSEIDKMIRDVGRHRLPLNHKIKLLTGEIITVADILENLEKYHRAPCRDPIEPDYAASAMIYTNENPVIHSYAHGETTYTLIGKAEKKEQNELSALFREAEKTPEKFALPSSPDDTDLESFFRQRGSVVFIGAATGSGKSYTAAKIVVERLRAGIKTFYVANIKKDMVQFYATVCKQLGKEKDSYLSKIALISADHQQQIQDDALLVVTHHTFITRKTLSCIYYSTLLWINKDVVVIIDEFARCADKQKTWVTVGERYKYRNKKRQLVHLEQCPKKSGSGNCERCWVTTDVWQKWDTFGGSRIIPHIPGETGSNHLPEKLDFPGIGQIGQYKTLFAQDLKCRKRDLKTRVYECKYDAAITPTGLKNTIQDILDCSFQPRKYWTSALDEEGNAAPVDDEKAVVFPAQTCEIERICAQDMSALAYILSNAEKTILLNAPLKPDSSPVLFLNAVAKECSREVVYTEPPNQQKRVQTVGLILFKGNLAPNQIDLDDLFLSFSENENILWFAPTEKKAKRLFASLPVDFPAGLVEGNNVFRPAFKRDAKGDKFVIITNAFGSLPVGINRPHDRLCFVDSRIYQPCFSLAPGVAMTPETIQKALRENATERAKQCLGRFLRNNPDYPDHPKVGVLYGLENVEIDIAEIKENFKGVVENFTVLEIGDKDYFDFTLGGSLRTGKFPEVSEADFKAKKLSGRPLRKVSPKDRALPERKKARAQAVKQTRQESAKDRQAELIEEAKQLHRQGRKWREIERHLHLARFKRLARKIKRLLSQFRRDI